MRSSLLRTIQRVATPRIGNARYVSHGYNAIIDVSNVASII